MTLATMLVSTPSPDPQQVTTDGANRGAAITALIIMIVVVILLMNYRSKD